MRHRSDDTRDLPLEAIDQYLSLVRHVEPLTAEAEGHLLHALRTNQRPDGRHLRQPLHPEGLLTAEARDRLVVSYQPLVIGIAKRFGPSCTFLSLLDLVQEGNLGLLQALDRYDIETTQASFGTWATWWITGSIRLAIWRAEGALRLPRRKVRGLQQLQRLTLNFLSTQGRPPSLYEAAEALALRPAEVSALLQLQVQQQVVSIDTWRDADGDGIHERELVTSAHPGSERADVLRAWVCAAVEELPEPARQVMELRYGFADGAARTQQEVEDQLRMTRAQVDAIDRQIRRRLRIRLTGSAQGTRAAVAA
jgi:RNA polymerase sigma factor (sigma-70 family)